MSDTNKVITAGTIIKALLGILGILVTFYALKATSSGRLKVE